MGVQRSELAQRLVEHARACRRAVFLALRSFGLAPAVIELARSGEADAASIDSNVLLRENASDLRVIESWGPFAIQATIVRAGLGAESKSRVAEALLTLHERHSLERFGFARFLGPDESLYVEFGKILE